MNLRGLRKEMLCEEDKESGKDLSSFPSLQTENGQRRIARVFQSLDLSPLDGDYPLID